MDVSCCKMGRIKKISSQALGTNEGKRITCQGYWKA